MAPYSVTVDKRVRKKDLIGIPKEQLRKIAKRIGDLADDPRPNGSEKLTGREEYRIRQGAYRVLYEIDDKEISVTVRAVAHRRETYR